MPRLDPPPSSITGPLGDYLRILWRTVDGMPTFSYFSGVSPNQSGVSGFPGDVTINLTSQNTNARLWIMAGGQRVKSTSNWSLLLP